LKEKFLAVVFVFLLFLVYENVSLRKKITDLYSNAYSTKIRLLHSKHHLNAKIRKQVKLAPIQAAEDQLQKTESEESTIFQTQEILNQPPMNSPPPNRNFVFHNKVPKCGGTSLKYILYVLSEDNNFTLDYQPPCIQGKTGCNKRPEDGTDGEISLAHHLAAKRRDKTGKFFLLKHHHWMNFTDIGMENPIYMNVVRHPVGRFSSAYYFKRFGFEKMGSDDRPRVGMLENFL